MTITAGEQQIECNTGDSTEDNTEDNFGDMNTETQQETEVNLDEVSKIEASSDETQTLKGKNEVLERKFEKAEETISTLTKEKFEAEETINTLTKEYKLKVETLEFEVAKLKEEISKKEQL